MTDQLTIAGTFIKLARGNIVEAGTEAIVNAANEDLEPGDGVCGAIYEAAGFDWLDNITHALGGCPAGSAVITPAGEIALPTRYIIHAVTPRYNPSRDEQDCKLLASAYEKSLRLAAEQGLRSIAFPSIGSGHHGYPPVKAADTAIRAVTGYLEEREPDMTSLETVLFVLYSFADLENFREALEGYEAAGERVVGSLTPGFEKLEQSGKKLGKGL